MKMLFACVALVLSACSFSPALLARVPRTITPQIGNTGECSGSEIKIEQAQLYSDHNQRWSLIAEATNMRVDDYEIVQVCITLQNKGSDKPIEETQYIGAGLRGYETAPFRVLLNSNLDQAERVTVAVMPASVAPANLEQSRIMRSRRNFVYSIAGINGNVFAPMRVVGRLRSRELQAMTNVRLIIGMYDRDGKLIGVANGRVDDLAPLEPGAVAPFTATSNMLLAPIASTVVLIEGEPAR